MYSRCIYRLINPKTFETFYIGSTMSPKTRKWNHTLDRSIKAKQKLHKDLYIIEMDCDPVFEVIDYVKAYPLYVAVKYEEKWIRFFSEKGHPIQNKRRYSAAA